MLTKQKWDDNIVFAVAKKQAAMSFSESEECRLESENIFEKRKIKKVLTKDGKRDTIYLADAQKVSTENLDN